MIPSAWESSVSKSHTERSAYTYILLYYNPIDLLEPVILEQPSQHLLWLIAGVDIDCSHDSFRHTPSCWPNRYVFVTWIRGIRLFRFHTGHTNARWLISRSLFRLGSGHLAFWSSQLWPVGNVQICMFVCRYVWGVFEMFCFCLFKINYTSMIYFQSYMYVHVWSYKHLLK